MTCPLLSGRSWVRIQQGTQPEARKFKFLDLRGDTIRIWYDGLVQEIYPPIIPNVYRVVKEEQEPAGPEPSETKSGIKREDGERFG